MLARLCSQRCVVASSLRLLSAAAAAAPSQSVDKESLMKLRKKTGYSYVNCRKALLQFGPDQLAEAEKWLRELAVKEGWAKAAKLSSRATTQGLVGVATSGNAAVIVELSCETDFVARGDNFKNLLAQLTKSALNHAKSQASEGDRIAVFDIDLETLKNDDGKTLREVVTMSVGKLGENLNVKSLRGFTSPEGAQLYGNSHPKDGTNDVSMGRFVSLVALKRSDRQGLFPSEKLAAQICQHVIGMRPEKLGEAPAPKAASAADTSDNKSASGEEADELNAFEQVQSTEIDADETSLLRQAFMLNPSQTVFDYVSSHEAQLVDFVRCELDNPDS